MIKFRTIRLASALYFLAMLIAVGCDAVKPEGTKEIAQAIIEQELAKWMSGQKSELVSSHSLRRNEPPISYEIRSMVPAAPDVFAQTVQKDMPRDWKTWPAFQANAVLHWNSKAGTPMQTVERFKLTWNPYEKKWFGTKTY
jgi:hypothetical protein